MNLDELRNDIAKKQKKGLPFICASVIIWLLIVMWVFIAVPDKMVMVYAILKVV